jgi:hypothetical protein
MVSKWEDSLQNGRKYLQIILSDKALVSKLHNELTHLDSKKKKKKKTEFKNRQRTWTAIFPKKPYKWQQVYEKVLNVTNHQRNQIKLSELGWLLFKKQVWVRVWRKKEAFYIWQCKSVEPLWK